MRLNLLPFQKLILWSIFALAGMMPLQLLAEANYVYHTRDMGDPMPGCNQTPYVSNYTPSIGSAVTLAFKVEYQFYTNTAALYYTTDGSNPSGAFGVPSGTTQVVMANFDCTFGGGQQIDVWKATIPGQNICTTVKYTMSAWHSGGGDEIFANGPGSPCNCGTPTNNSALATIFSYNVINADLLVELDPRNIKCYGDATGKIKASASGGPGNLYNYLWNDNSTEKIISGLGTGTYSVTVGDSQGCTVTASATINEPPSPLFIDDITMSFVLEGYWVGVAASGGWGDYRYARSGGSGLQQNYFFIIPFGEEGLYTFKVRDNGGLGCTTGEQFYISKGTNAAPTGDEGSVTNLADQASIFPNPTSGEFTLQVDLAQSVNLEIIVTDLVGNKLQQLQVEAVKGINTFILDASAFPAGIYQVSLLGTEEPLTLPLVKTK